MSAAESDRLKPCSPPSPESWSAMQEELFRSTIDVRELLATFEEAAGIVYFVKDVHGRMMASSRDSLRHMGIEGVDIVGKLPHEYLPRELADKYAADDERVFRTGEPLRNIVEMGFNEQGVRDWIITDKFPLRDRAGAVVGLVGTIQSLEARRRLLAPVAPVGLAADFIHDHLGESIQLKDVAAHVSLSERHLQRLFRRVFAMTIQQFIIQSRIHAAIRELTHSERSIAEIALMFGFSDQSAFSNRFRQVTGLPPRAYRQRYVSKFTPGPAPASTRSQS
jgi:PAS domain S-box-containing protein